MCSKRCLKIKCCLQYLGSLSITGTTTTGSVLDVYANVVGVYSGNLLTGRAFTGSILSTQNVISLTEGANVLMAVSEEEHVCVLRVFQLPFLLCCQTSTNGVTTFGVGPVSIAVGGLTVTAGGLTVSSGGMSITGDEFLYGSVSVTSQTSTTAATLDAYASYATYTGNVLSGRLVSAATANLMTLTEGTNVLFQVRVPPRLKVCCRAITLGPVCVYR